MEIEEEPEESLPTSNSINDYMKYRETIEELSQVNLLVKGLRFIV